VKVDSKESIEKASKQIGVGIFKKCHRCNTDLTKKAWHETKRALFQNPLPPYNRKWVTICMVCYTIVKAKKLDKAKPHDKDLNKWAENLGIKGILDKKDNKEIS
jgi:hypothetical protein